MDDHQAAVLLDDLDAAGPVGAGPGQDDGDGALPLFLCQRGEEDIDGVVEHAVVEFGQIKPSAAEGQVVLGRNEIDSVRAYRHLIFRLQDAHLGVLAENVGHQALVIGRQMLDHDKAQPAVGGHVLEKLLKGLQPSGRRSDADNERGIRLLSFLPGLYGIVRCHQGTSFESFQMGSVFCHICQNA